MKLSNNLKKWWKWLALQLVIFTLGVGVGSHFFPKAYKNSNNKPSLKDLGNVFFASVPVAEFSSSELPCLNIEIGNQSCLALLDLGYRGTASVNKELLRKISEKSFIKTRTMYGFRGKEYQEDVYRVPEIKIGYVTIHHPSLQEENSQKKEDSIIVREENKPCSRAQGKLGWELFRDTNLFLDLGNSKVAFCDGVEMLKKQGYPIETFTKVPLLLDRGLIEFEAIVDDRPIRCTLDTGATWNILHIENTEEKDLKEMALDPQNLLKLETFRVGGKNFGPIPLHRFPIKLPIQIEVMLGMEFFRAHLVFIDFWNNQIYFSSAKTPE